MAITEIIPCKEELSFSSLLAILLKYDDTLLKSFLEIINKRLKRKEYDILSFLPEKNCPQVETEMSLTACEGRFDIVINWSANGDEYELILEIKVASLNAHGSQFSKYEKEIDEKRKDKKKRVFGLLAT